MPRATARKLFSNPTNATTLNTANVTKQIRKSASPPPLGPSPFITVNLMLAMQGQDLFAGSKLMSREIAARFE
jgi:hypothetical protein